jgi:hypothetical protein
VISTNTCVDDSCQSFFRQHCRDLLHTCLEDLHPASRIQLDSSRAPWEVIIKVDALENCSALKTLNPKTLRKTGLEKVLVVLLPRLVRSSGLYILTRCSERQLFCFRKGKTMDHCDVADSFQYEIS